MAPTTVLDKVVSAIETLAEPGGASRPAIAKCVKSLNAGVEVSSTLLKKALVTGVKKGKLGQTGSSPPASQPQSAGFRVYRFPENDGFRIGDPSFRIGASESGTLVSESGFPNRRNGF